MNSCSLEKLLPLNVATTWKTGCLLLAVLTLSLAGCGTDGTTEPRTAAATTGDETAHLHIGMSQAQVIRALGEPTAKQVSGRGEIWVYGAGNWLRSIPYAGPFLHVKTAKVLFGTDGRVQDYRLTDKGDVMSESEGFSGGCARW